MHYNIVLHSVALAVSEMTYCSVQHAIGTGRYNCIKRMRGHLTKLYTRLKSFTEMAILFCIISKTLVKLAHIFPT